LVYAIVEHRRDVQEASIPRDGHLVGARRVERGAWASAIFA